jgi:signal transduction histidine kinase
VILNFQSNALKFTSPNDKVSITCTKKGDFIEIAVSDTGNGIQEEDIPKLFKLFGYLKQSEQINTNGIGLGLHITEKIVRKFGG